MMGDRKWLGEDRALVENAFDNPGLLWSALSRAHDHIAEQDAEIARLKESLAHANSAWEHAELFRMGVCRALGIMWEIEGKGSRDVFGDSHDAVSNIKRLRVELEESKAIQLRIADERDAAEAEVARLKKLLEAKGTDAGTKEKEAR